MNTRCRQIGLATFVSLASACSAETNPPFHFGDAGGDGSTASDGAIDSGRAETAVDAAPSIPSFVSDPPGAKYIDKDPSIAPGLVLISSRFAEERLSSEYFQQWYGELRNSGPNTYCYVQVTVSLQDAAGVEKASFFTFADAAPFVRAGSTSTLSIPCIAPGARAMFYSNNFATTPADPSTIRRVEAEFEVTEGEGAVPDPSAPAIDSSTVVSTSFGYAVSGTLRARATVHNIAVEIYPVVFGVPYKQLLDHHLDDLVKGATFDFESNTVERSFTDYALFTSYIRGAATAFAPPASNADGFTPQEAEFRDFHARRAERAALYLRLTKSK